MVVRTDGSAGPSGLGNLPVGRLPYLQRRMGTREDQFYARWHGVQDDHSLRSPRRSCLAIQAPILPAAGLGGRRGMAWLTECLHPLPRADARRLGGGLGVGSLDPGAD